MPSAFEIYFEIINPFLWKKYKQMWDCVRVIWHLRKFLFYMKLNIVQNIFSWLRITLKISITIYIRVTLHFKGNSSA